MQNVFVKQLFSCERGLVVRIAGQVPEEADWFAVNLQTGSSIQPRSDIALHISPRFEGTHFRVVRNSLINQQWGPEENDGSFPFKLGEEFEIIILVELDKYMIAVNGRHFTEFYHRLPHQAVNTILIDGDVLLYLVEDKSANGVQPSAPVESTGQLGGYPVTGRDQPYPSCAPPPYPAVEFVRSPRFDESVHRNAPYPAGQWHHRELPPQARLVYGSEQYGAPVHYPPYPTQQVSSAVDGNQAPQGSNMPIPEHSPKHGRKSSFLKALGVGAAAGVGAFALSQLAYPAISNLSREVFDDTDAHQCKQHTNWGSSDSDSSEE